MSETNSDSGEKSFEATEKRLSDARKKGDVAKSADISVAASYLGLIVAFLVAGPVVVSSVGAALTSILANADDLSRQIFSAGGTQVALFGFGPAIAKLIPFLAIPFLFVVLSVIAQGSLIFAPDKIAPKMSRISPVTIAKNRFGLSGWFEFLKSLTKLVVVSIAVWMFFSANLQEIIGSIYGAPGQISGFMGEKLVQLTVVIFLIALAIGAVDYLWQAFDHKRKLMMTRQEIMDETKQNEGDPHLKQERRARGYDIATQRMMADVPKADVVIVNPQHYAVALKWDRNSESAPVCVAKGVDEIAARIRERAAEAAVPIHRDPPTARAIFATVEIGQEVLPEHYKAVAAAVRYAERIRAMAARQT